MLKIISDGVVCINTTTGNKSWIRRGLKNRPRQITTIKAIKIVGTVWSENRTRIKELGLDPALYVVRCLRADNRKKYKRAAYCYRYTFQKQYYAMGLFGQVLYVDPERNLIGVRLGSIKDAQYDEVICNVTRDR